MILIIYISTKKLKYKSLGEKKYQENTICLKNIKEETHNNTRDNNSMIKLLLEIILLLNSSK